MSGLGMDGPAVYAASNYALLDERRLVEAGHTEHTQRILAEMKERGTPYEGQSLDEVVVTHLAAVDTGRHFVVTSQLSFGGGEVDDIIVIGMYQDHDGQLTTVMNTVDDYYVLDNANELFGKEPQGDNS